MSKSVGSVVRRLLAGGRLVGYRAELAALEVVAPRRAVRRAAELWFTPPPPVATRSPRPLPGTDFELLVDGMPIRGTVWGSGPLVYFMHGWGGRGRQVRSLVEPLLAAGRSVVTFDGPGHGSGPRVRTHAGRLGAALAAVIGHHGPAEAVVAHSLGAVAVARAVAAESASVPRLVLLAPLVDARAQLDRFADLLQLGPRTRAGLADEVYRQTGLTLDQFSPRSLRDRVAGRDVLIAHDRLDPFIPYANTATFARSWVGAELLSTEGLGHYRLLDDPSVVASVARFVTRETVSRDRVASAR